MNNEFNTTKEFIFVHPHLRFGGAENQTVLTVNNLVERGHKCTVILHKKEGGLLGRLDPRVEVRELGFSKHFLIPLGSLKLSFLLRRMPSSLVVAKLWSSILMVALAPNKAKKHTYRFYEDSDPQDHGSYVRFGNIKNQLVKYIYSNNVEKIIANTHHVAESLKRVYELSQKPKVIECGIDVEDCRAKAKIPVELPEAKGALRIVTVGSLIPIKGLLELKNQLYKSQFPIEWFIVGEGPLATELSMPLPIDSFLKIYLVGSTPNPYRYIAAADLLLHGSISESFGVVILESLALGTPVLANSSRGPIEISNILQSDDLELFNILEPNSLLARLKSCDDRIKLKKSDSPVVFPARFEIKNVSNKWLSETE